jgi:hypothetical protein
LVAPHRQRKAKSANTGVKIIAILKVPGGLILNAAINDINVAAVDTVKASQKNSLSNIAHPSFSGRPIEV